MKNTHRKARFFGSSRAMVVMLLIIVGALIVVAIVLHHHEKKAVSGQIKTITSTGASSASNPPVNPSQPTAPDKSSSGSQSPTTQLVAPHGSLVSNHKPGQDGSNMTELSQCITTAGATCYIKFVQGDVTKTLPEKTADSDGSIFWEWDVNDAGLTSGKWIITAVTALGDQTKTTTDQLSLEVQ